MKRIPGFTADFSVVPPQQKYTKRAVPLLGSVSSVLLQTLPSLGLRGSGTCIPNCICVGPYQCPCCTFEEQWGRGGMRQPVYFSQ